MTQAVQIYGGVRPLAQALRISRMRLECWLSGVEETPTPIFLMVVDLLSSRTSQSQQKATTAKGT